MVLFGFILRVTRALVLPFFGNSFFLRWLLTPSASLVSSRCRVGARSLLHVPEFHQTGCLILSDVYLMNHWFFSVMGLLSLRDLSLFLWISAQAYFLCIQLLQVVKAVWLVAKRKPPDPGIVLFLEGGSQEPFQSCFDTKVPVPFSDASLLDDHSSHAVCIDLVETILSTTNVCRSLTSSVLSQDPFRFDWSHVRSHFLRPRRVLSLALLNNNARSSCVSGSGLDLHSRSFVVDSGSSDHLCNDKSLFVGDIRPIPGVTLQGIGGVIRAEGYGTVKFFVYDDEGRRHTFRVHNVLYVPAAPMKLISPQRWVSGMPEKERQQRGALAVVMDDVTLLLWGDRKYTKTIHHSPLVDLPLLLVNESLSGELEGEPLPYPMCQPCFKSYLNTSTTSN